MSLRVSADGLSVDRGQRNVLRDVSFSVGPGVTALVGRNGAGKSTLLLTLVGLLAPQVGVVRLGSGQAAGSREACRHLGWMPQHLQFPRHARVNDTVDYAAWLRGVDDGREDAVATALATADLDSLARRRAGTLSGGEVRRLGLACAVVGAPEVLVLDEPTVGLDPLQREDILGRIRDLGTRHCVVLSTHIVEDLTDAADHVLALDQGRIAFDGPLADLAGPDAAHEQVHNALKSVLGSAAGARP